MEGRGGRGEVLPEGKIGDIGVMPMQDQLPSMVSLLPTRESPEVVFRGGIWQQYDCSAK